MLVNQIFALFKNFTMIPLQSTQIKQKHMKFWAVIIIGLW